MGAGIRLTGEFEHSEDWVAPDGTPLRFADDPAMADGVTSAERMEVDGVPIRVATAATLLKMKLRAARDPSQRRSKRVRDLADAITLVEQDPTLRAALDADEVGQLG